MSHTKHHKVWKDIKSNKTCLACLQAVPDHVLACGHSYCPRCVQELGDVSHQSECAWNMQCWLCWEEKGRDSHLIQLKPRCAGVRILTLDGGGIRGIVELAVLEALQILIGLDSLPIKALFDLVVGTSTGGIIALALARSTKGSGTESVSKMTSFFEKASEKTFEQSALEKFARYGLIAVRLRDSVFKGDALKQATQDYFEPKETTLFAPALHAHHHLMSSGTRVAVTAAKDMGKTACLVASYNHPFHTPDSILEREEDASKDMKIWEAAMATAAAPFYLPPFVKAETGTAYVDGAVWANCPAQVAYNEMARIWTDGTGRTAPLDVLVSLGTGMQRCDSEKGPEIPSLVNMGFLVSLRAIFQRQLDSKSTWASFKEAAPAHVRPRLHRFDPPLRADRDGGDCRRREDVHVQLYDYKMLPKLRQRVQEWTRTLGAKELEHVANTLIANLFFFEPDHAPSPSSSSSSRLSQKSTTVTTAPRSSALSDRTNDVLHGSIRCRLGHQTPQLLHLLRDMVEGFAFAQLGAAVATAGVIDAVRRLPASQWDPVRTAASTPVDMMVDEVVSHQHAVQKFRVPYSIVVKRGSPGLLVLGVKLRRCERRIAISGFPVSMAELKTRAEAWPQ